MSTTEPQPTTTPSPVRRHSPWIWVSAVLVLVCIGLLVWALTLDSDLQSTQDDVTALQAQVAQAEESGGTVTAALKTGFDTIAEQIGATQADVAATQEQIGAAKAKITQAQEDAQTAATQATDNANNAADRVKARVDEAQARAEEAGAKTQIAVDCGKAYMAALGTLFSGDSVTAQVSAVREQLQSISADCQGAFAGS